MPYKSYIFVKNIVEKKFNMPSQGLIAQFGVHPDCATLKRLITQYGKDRVVGYDHNTKIKHENVLHIDFPMQFPQGKLQYAFSDIDVGPFDTHAFIRQKILLWVSKRTVKNGLIMVNSPMVTDNIWQESGHDYMIRNGFKCHRFVQYINEEWYQETLLSTDFNPATTCLYEKVGVNN